LIIDDHRLFAEAIRVTLDGSGFSDVGIVTNAEDGLAAAREDRPELVLMDIGLPDRNGLALGKQILEELPRTKIVALTAH
jgi:DNA-binding NarL/FixJ family response regulator